MRPGRSPLRDLPVPARIYILAVTAAGVAGALLRLQVEPVLLSADQLVLIGLAVAFGPSTVRLGMRVEMSGALPFIFTAMLAHGVGAAVDVSVASMLATCVLRRNPFEAHRTAFNVSSILLTTLLSGGIYAGIVSGEADLFSGRFLGAVMAAVLAYYFLNTAMVAIAVGFARRLSILKLWHDSFLWTSISYFAGGSLAVAMVALLRSYGSASLLLALPPVALILYSYRLYQERMEERRKRIETIERLNVELEKKVDQRTRELQELNDRLQDSNRELQRVSRMKSEFLANVSHELRTPLNAIIGFSELLGEGVYGPLNGQQADFVRDIHEAGRHLLSLINDILDLSKIEAGRMSLSREEFDVADLIRECVTVIRPLALKKNLMLSVDSRTAPAVGWADSGMLKQLMYNLLSNAVKFTPEGGRVSVLCRAEGSDLVVSVSDTGIGIPREDQNRIFSEFYQVDGSYARRYQGTGLGLALARRFVEMHGGSIAVDSEPGQGATFSFRIPDAVRGHEPEARAPAGAGSSSDAGPAPAVAEPVEPGRRGTVLVVEDNPTNMKLTTGLLLRAGFSVVEARDGEEAFARLREALPDLILMDIQLPGIDGLELTRRLKSDPRTAGVPTVALTAHAMKGDEQRALEAGCCGYIPKPVDPSRFARQVGSFLKTAAAEAAAEETIQHGTTQ